MTSDTGPIKLTFDNSPPDGCPGVLLGFVEGHAARVFSTLSAAERRARALACFVRYFGKRAAQPDRLHRDELVRPSAGPAAATSATRPPGVLTDYGPCDPQAGRPDPLGRR